MTPRAVSCAAGLLLLAAACSKHPARVDLRVGGTSSSPGASASAAPPASATPHASKATGGAVSTPAGGTSSASTPKPASQGGYNLPKDGKYAYRVDGTATDPFNPAGPPRQFTNQESDFTYSHSGNVYTQVQTSSQQGQRSTTKSRWEATRVLLLSVLVESPAGNFSCTYNPPPVIARFPVRPEGFPTQQLTGSGNACGGTLDITVVRQEQVKDATGKSWSTWRIQVKTLTRSSYNGQPLTISSDETRWVSPELGVEIRSEATSQQQFGSGPTAQKYTGHYILALKSHP